MKNQTRCVVFLALPLLTILCLPDVALAAEERPWYLGLEIGLVSLDETGFDEPTQAGVLLGYKFAQGDWGSVAVEAEYSDTISKGDLDFPGGEWSAETLGGYVAYRTANKRYFKGKIGYAEVTADFRALGLRQKADDSDVSAGIGFGWRFRKNTALEIEWTRSFLDADVDFFSIGVNF